VEQGRRKVEQEGCRHRSIPLPALRAARRSMALSQRQLAEMAGVSANTVRLLEGGRRGAYPSTLRKLASALGVTPADLIRGPHPGGGEEHVDS
jgi:transcriptional regulator with XRE-family HTH domain